MDLSREFLTAETRANGWRMMDDSDFIYLVKYGLIRGIWNARIVTRRYLKDAIKRAQEKEKKGE